MPPPGMHAFTMPLGLARAWALFMAPYRGMLTIYIYIYMCIYIYIHVTQCFGVFTIVTISMTRFLGTCYSSIYVSWVLVKGFSLSYHFLIMVT